MGPLLQVDIREDQKYIDKIREVMPKYDIEVKVAMYEVGDYFIGNLIGIEHKTADDFTSSLTSGRLFQQADELAQNFRIPLVLVDAQPEQVVYNHYNHQNPNSIWAGIASLHAHHNTPVIFCGPNNLVTMIIWYCLKATKESTQIYNPIRRDASNKERQLHLLSALPGVGEKRAKAILEIYKTPLNALVNHEFWKDNVKGVGDETSKRVERILKEPPVG